MKGLQSLLSAFMIILWFVLVTTPLHAKGGSGGVSSGGYGGGGTGSGNGQAADGRGMDLQGETRQMMQEQNRLTVRQRAQLIECQGRMELMQNRTREMARLSTGSALQAGELERHRLNVRNEFRQLEDDQDQFAAGLNTRDRDRLKDRLHDMDRERDRISTCLQDIDSELRQSNPDPVHLRDRIQDMEQAMERWKEQSTQIE